MNYNLWIIKSHHIPHFELIADASLDDSIDRHQSLSDDLLSMSSTLNKWENFEELIELDIVRTERKCVIHSKK